MLVVACTYTGLFTFISGSSHVLIGLVGLTPDLFGLCFATGVLSFIAGSLLAGRLTLRVGAAGLMPVGASISALAGLFGLSLALLTPPSVPGVVGPMVLFMLGAGFTFPSAIALALAPYRPRPGLPPPSWASSSSLRQPAPASRSAPRSTTITRHGR